jgi:hypothetical protein
MVDAFAELNVDIETVLKYIKKKSIDQITVGDMPILAGIYNAMKDNAFNDEEEKKSTKTDKLNEELNAKEEAKKVADEFFGEE